MPDDDEALLDWRIWVDDVGHVILQNGLAHLNLGPRDEVFVRFADLMGEDGPR